MNYDIIEKLNEHVLGDGLRSEAGVVYLLVQLAKLVEREHLRDAYPHLMFYRNWAVHSRLDRTDFLVAQFEGVLEQGGAEGWDVETIGASLSEKMRGSLAGLRAEIRLAFESLTDSETGARFSDVLCHPEATWWSVVADSLLSILSDIPVETRDGNMAIQLSGERNALRISRYDQSFEVECRVPED